MTPPTPQTLQAFRSLLAAKMGLEFPEERVQLLADALTARANQRHQSAEAYLAALTNGALDTEFAALAARLTVPESYFFRNADQFSALRESVIPALVAGRAPNAGLRVLSAGCASGEEPYSLAITLKELVGSERTVSIVAVDMNPDALERARRAVYSEWALRETSPAVREQWFRKNGRDFELQTQTLGGVHFVECNLASPAPSVLIREHYDLIFCRNMLMYLTRDKYIQVATRLGQSLLPGGFLFLGHAETLRGADQDFETQQGHGTFYYRKVARGSTRRARVPTPPEPPFQAYAQRAADVVESEATPDTLPWFDAISQASARIVALSERLQLGAAPSELQRKEAPFKSQGSPYLPEPEKSAADSALRPVLNLLRQERYAEALTLIDAVSASIDSRAVLPLKALLLTHAGRGADAEQSCQELLRVDSINPGAHYILALCRDGAADAPGALRHYERAASLDPSFAMPRLHLGLLQRRLGDSAAAQHNLRIAETLLAQEAEARILLFGGGFSREALIAMSAGALRALKRGAA